ncbi:P-loop containing nucleoside triphosphate hydrolase protein [Rhizophagus clarus]|uniref:P-loop containing nucleoside triphosphate hydrolase protein n=1 Tax=Rhizophagus clarus TaxID=94130 RepID=A0A8H3L7F9_9GLOM|nr:P-loop containing nucleoside triphosphate hydrolase protein [Rhizophagus clarus]
MNGIYNEAFQPHISNIFTQSQVNTALLAWLPTKLEPYLTGIMAVDMFITTVLASGITTLAFKFFRSLRKGVPWKNDKTVTIQIEYYTTGKYGIQNVNVFYEALSWIISQQTKKLDKGSFVVRPITNLAKNFFDRGDDDDEFAPPGFNILPENDQQITIEYDGKEFYVTIHMSEQEIINNGNNILNHNFEENIPFPNPNSNTKKSAPSIYLTTAKDANTSVDDLSEFLNQIVRSYLENQKKMKIRSRYERSENMWQNIHPLSSIKGLDSVALDESLEKLLKKELDLFINDKGFYERVGMPYRRGILLYGRPGTGKTSLINAISSHLSRNIYYLNLKNISDDNELSAAFSDVPENQIIVLEDVDAQSEVLHKRSKNSNTSSTSSSTKSSKKDKDSKVDNYSKFSLSTFLGCLDGHSLSEGNIIIMTTNHIEYLDPACIRPGRMDVRLNLGYCSHYQIKKMFKSVVENPEIEFSQEILEKIPENLLPPCEVMMTMVLYRNEIERIPQMVYELVAKYKDMKPEDIAKQMEEEAASYGKKEEPRPRSLKVKNEIGLPSKFYKLGAKQKAMRLLNIANANFVNQMKKGPYYEEQINDEVEEEEGEEELEDEDNEDNENNEEARKVDETNKEVVKKKGEPILSSEEDIDNSSNTDIEVEDGYHNVKNF